MSPNSASSWATLLCAMPRSFSALLVRSMLTEIIVYSRPPGKGVLGRAIRDSLLEWVGGNCMHEVTKEIRFCYGHRLLRYEGKCRHLHGHNGRAVITLAAAKLDSLGMVLDFSQIKKV